MKEPFLANLSTKVLYVDLCRNRLCFPTRWSTRPYWQTTSLGFQIFKIINLIQVITAMDSSNRAYHLVFKELETQYVAEQEKKMEAMFLQVRLEREQELRVVWHTVPPIEKGQVLCLARATHVSRQLQQWHNIRDSAALCIRRWYNSVYPSRKV